MGDRPSAVNGKRHRAWGTTEPCPACGRCLCFGCHPAGPCVDEPAHAVSLSRAAVLAASRPAASGHGSADHVR